MRIMTGQRHARGSRHRRRLGLLRPDRAAVAAVEMGLVGALVFVPVLGGVTGLGQGLLLQSKLDRALHAAVLTGYAAPSRLTSANVQNMMATAVQYGYGNNDPSTVASLSYYCISPTGTRSGTGAATAPSCNSPNVVATYLVVSASVSFVPLINVGIWSQTGSGGAVTVSSSATVRIQ